jgi:hypothetical protein
MSNPLSDWDTWKAHMRVAIQAASIVRECHDKMARGEGAPDEDDMVRYRGEAAAIADLWDESFLADGGEKGGTDE